MMHTVKIIQSCLSSVFEAGKGMAGTSKPIQPAKMLELYDMEGCPYCRRVREVLTSLNIDFLVKPCPKGGLVYRKEIAQHLSKLTYPVLHDPNTGVYLPESQDIISYLYQHYSNRTLPNSLAKLPRFEVQGMLVSAASMLRGIKADPDRDTSIIPKVLELYSFEGSPYSRPVRERLCELEISYVCRNVAKERWQDAGPAILRLKPGPYHPKTGGKREFLQQNALSKKVQVPFLIDPNYGIEMYESAKIIRYLNLTYALPTA
jgi:glutathione S-transferase